MSIIYNIHYHEERDEFSLRISKNGVLRTKTVRLEELRVNIKSMDDVLFKSEVDRRDECASAVFDCGKLLRMLRLAAIMGMTPGSCVGLGATPIPFYDEEHCTMGYDIECSSNSRTTSLPLPCDTITCASLVCSCGYTRSYRTLGVDSSGLSTLYSGSTELCVALHSDILKHKPVWLVGYNSFGFDNLFLSYHDRSAKYIKIHNKSRRSPFNLLYYEEGINNVDLYQCLDVAYRSRFQSLSLGRVAEELGLGTKMHMPSDEAAEEDMANMVQYNILDSKLTTEIFRKLKYSAQLMSSCTVMKSALIDVVRNVTGVMCACMLSSYSLSDGKLIDWSRCTFAPISFEGGRVYEPICGYHECIMVVDFKSMYPSIMMCASISHDNVSEYVDGDFGCNEVSWDNESVCVTTPESRVTFRNNPDCISTKVLQKLIEYRSVYGSRNKIASASIKAATNSLYGTLGYESSPVYSPRASRCVTTIARWLLDRSRTVFERCGLKVIYGDTDSLFLSSLCASPDPEALKLEVEAALRVFHVELKDTPFSEMLLRIEDSEDGIHSAYKGVIMLNKKMYILIRYDGETQAKGVAIRRKDRLGVTVEAYKHCIAMISKYSISYITMFKISRYLVELFRNVVTYGCRVEEISLRKRVSGNSCFVYRDSNGEDAVLEESSVNSRRYVIYDRKYVIDNIRRTIDPMLRSCELRSSEELISMFNTI